MEFRFWFRLNLLMVIMTMGTLFAQTVVYDSIPSKYQLYPRNAFDNDSAIVQIKGNETGGGFDSITVDIKRNGIFWRQFSQTLTYNNNVASFSLSPKIYADTVEFQFIIKFWTGGTAFQDALIDSVVCGDVYLIQGQSNAQADIYATFTSYQSQWVRSFGTTTDRNGLNRNGIAATTLDTLWGLAQADSINSHLAVGIWGLKLGDLISSNQGIPVCIINGSPGGTDIKQHQRNDANPTDLTTVYGRLLYRVQHANLSPDVKALIWWQGESNSSSVVQANTYANKFPPLRADWRTDYANIQKIYTTQIYAGYASGTAGTEGGLLRERQRQLAQADPGTEIMTANALRTLINNAHFDQHGYETYANRVYNQIRRDFYNATDTVEVDPPNITKAFFTSPQKDVLVLEFGNANLMVWQNDTTIGANTYFLKDYFYLHNSSGSIDTSIVSTGQVFGNKVRLALTQSSSAVSVTYLPNRYYNNTTTSYLGPWLRNSRGIPALSFKEFVIDTVLGDDPLPITLSSFSATLVDEGVLLRWRTESEINNLGFRILRKEEGQKNFILVASYESNPALRGQGTTNQATDYQYIDTYVIPGKTYFYELQDVDINGNITTHGPIQAESFNEQLPVRFQLFQNYPNPFNPSTIISYSLPVELKVNIKIYDLLGREVSTLVNQRQDAGIHRILFDASQLQSGVYFYKIKAGDFSATKKMTFLR